MPMKTKKKVKGKESKIEAATATGATLLSNERSQNVTTM